MHCGIVKCSWYRSFLWSHSPFTFTHLIWPCSPCFSERWHLSTCVSHCTALSLIQKWLVAYSEYSGVVFVPGKRWSGLELGTCLTAEGFWSCPWEPEFCQSPKVDAEFQQLVLVQYMTQWPPGRWQRWGKHEHFSQVIEINTVIF